MRVRSSFAIVMTMALLAIACGGPAATPTAAPTAAPTTAPTTAPTDAPAKWVVGVVTDVGTVNDKNFNEYTFLGATNGAAAIGADPPTASVPRDASEYGALLDAWIEQGANIIVTAGFNLGVETTNAAHENPDVWFIGVDQGPPCVNEEGMADTTFQCAGDAATLLPNFVAISYEEDQAGYLAGMAAATASQTGEIGAIGGITLCGPCIRYIQGYVLGAQSVNPDIVVHVAWVTDSDFTKAFNDPDTGKNFGDQFLAQNPNVDVLFQVAGKTGNGVIDAACEAGIWGIGVDVDQALSYPNGAECIITSAEKKLAYSVEEIMKAIDAGTQPGGDSHWAAADLGVGYSPFHDNADAYPDAAALQTALDAALAQMVAGTLKTCPDACGDISTLP